MASPPQVIEQKAHHEPVNPPIIPFTSALFMLLAFPLIFHLRFLSCQALKNLGKTKNHLGSFGAVFRSSLKVAVEVE
jgi:hypothetical protein